MAEKKKETKTTPTTTKTGRTWSSTKILDCVAYFAIMFIAIALIFRLAFRGYGENLERAFASIGECLAYIICIWLGFYWTMRQRHGGWNKRNIWWLLCWLIATIVIVIIYIFAIL